MSPDLRWPTLVEKPQFGSYFRLPFTLARTIAGTLAEGTNVSSWSYPIHFVHLHHLVLCSNKLWQASELQYQKWGNYVLDVEVSFVPRFGRRS